jgi:hypothetical protein
MTSPASSWPSTQSPVASPLQHMDEEKRKYWHISGTKSDKIKLLHTYYFRELLAASSFNSLRQSFYGDVPEYTKN